jgi:hypothetical protein
MDAGSSPTTAYLWCDMPDRHPSRLGVRCRGLPRERPAVGARLLLLHHAWRRGAAFLDSTDTFITALVCATCPRGLWAPSLWCHGERGRVLYRVDVHRATVVVVVVATSIVTIFSRDWIFWAGSQLHPPIWAVNRCIKIRAGQIFSLSNNFSFLYLSLYTTFESKTWQFTEMFEIEFG